MSEFDSRLSQIKRTIDELSAEVPDGKFPVAILKEFKLSVDHLRLNLWAIIEFEDQAKKHGKGSPFGLSTKLVEFRIKRIQQMLEDLRADISSGTLAPIRDQVQTLRTALESALQALNPTKAGQA